MGAVEVLLDLIGMHPGLDLTAPLMQSVKMEGHYAVGSDTSVTFVGSCIRESPRSTPFTRGGYQAPHT